MNNLITDFNSFGLVHIIALLLPLFIGVLFIITGLNATTERKRKTIRILFVILLLLVRGSRYLIDLCVGRFDIYDLLSLQICHIDLILLIICFFKPNKVLFHITFLVGIPMGLAVALLPGKVHPEPGLSRAVLFIASHMLLVVGPIYLALVDKMKLKLSYLFYIIGIGNVFIIVAYIANSLLGTNFLYIMYAPKGTVIEQLSNAFGWPGYAIAMDLIAFSVIIFLFCVNKMIERLYRSFSLPD